MIKVKKCLLFIVNEIIDCTVATYFFVIDERFFFRTMFFLGVNYLHMSVIIP